MPPIAKKLLLSLYHFLCFFLFMAFLITCCMLLFLDTMADSLLITFTEENVREAAVITFANVVFLSILCAVIDKLRRVYTVERPVKQILSAAEAIMAGDYTVRIPPLRSMNRADGLDAIVLCFNKMAQELSGTETLRTDFVANVSHELKTPLSVIQNYGTILQQPDLPEETRMEYAKKITHTSRRLASLITNILKLNKLENQQIFPALETYDLHEQLCQCLLSFEEAWEAKQLDICTELEEGVMVEADSELLGLVWSNLFSNAIKFTDPGGCVTLTLKTQGPYAVVQVSDTGCGISPETGVHIFEKFYQGDTSHATQGNGLGLALVKRIMDIVGGNVSVKSEKGKGSTFTIRLRRK